MRLRFKITEGIFIGIIILWGYFTHRGKGIRTRADAKAIWERSKQEGWKLYEKKE